MAAKPPAFKILGNDVPLQKGTYTIWVTAPNAGWERVLQFVARLDRTWNAFTGGLAYDWNVAKRKPGGLTLTFPRNKTIVQNGRKTFLPRKGYDPKKKALFFLVELV